MEEGGGEGEGEEGESQTQGSSHHPEVLETVHGGQEEIRGYLCQPQSQAPPVRERETHHLRGREGGRESVCE